MGKKVGNAIKKARTEAGLTQEQLARKVKGASASDIGRAERGEKDLTQEQLKQIAKATGVTQKSLLDLAKGSSGKTGSTSTASKSSMQVTAAEKRLVQLYRKADASSKRAALKALKADETEEMLTTLLEGAIDLFTGKKQQS